MRTAQNGDVDLLRLRAQCFYSLGKYVYLFYYDPADNIGFFSYFYDTELLSLRNPVRVMPRGQSFKFYLTFFRACFVFIAGDLENALKHMQQAVRSDPDNTQVRAYYRQIKEIDEKK